MKLPDTLAYQQGLSLIELMIAMLLSSVLLLGLMTTLINNKQSLRLQNEIAEMDNNARTALFALRRSIAQAGYSSYYLSQPIKPFLTPSDKEHFINPLCRDNLPLIRNNSPIAKTHLFSSNTSDGYSDTITSAFMIDNPNVFPSAYRGCLGLNQQVAIACSADPTQGIKTPNEAKNYDRFYIKQYKDKSVLLCAGINGNPQPIADHIENMQILYGIKTSDKTTFFTATQVDAMVNGERNNPWAFVTQVQIALLVSSSKPLQPVRTQQFTLLDRTIIIPNSRKRYQVYSTTIHLSYLTHPRRL